MPTLHSRTVHGIVAELAAERGERVFLHFEDRRYTYAAIDNAAARVATGLQQIGVCKGDRVALMLSNRPEFLFAWFGISRLGAIEVPVNTAHRGELLAYLLNQSGSSVLVVERDLLGQVESIAGELRTLRHLVVLDGDGALPGVARLAWDELVDNAGDHAPVEVLGTDPAAMMFTSGTTGPSKGAVVPQNYQVQMAEFICRMADYTEADRLYNALPLFHGNAQTLSTMPALVSGASMVLARRFSATGFWDKVREYGCTEFNYIGGILPILLKAAPLPTDREHPVRIMVGAGAAKPVYEAFEARFGVTLIEGYGMSEIGLPLMSTPDARRPGSCGRLNPAYLVRLVDDAGEDVGDDAPGELLVRPQVPNAMMLEYFRMPEKTVEAWRDLWFRTGDYLRRDADGFYYFVDRKKDALRRRGENISSFEVERGVNAHPEVLESAAVAVSSELGEDEVMVCVVLRPGATLTPAELIAHCEARMAYFMVPRYLRFLPALPKTPTERVQKYLLRGVGVTADTWDRGARGGRTP